MWSSGICCLKIKKMNNLLNPENKDNFLFLASCIAVLCEQSPITLNLSDVERFWVRDIQRLKYDMVSEGKSGSITFSLKDKPDEN